MNVKRFILLILVCSLVAGCASGSVSKGKKQGSLQFSHSKRRPPRDNEFISKGGYLKENRRAVGEKENINTAMNYVDTSGAHEPVLPTNKKKAGFFAKLFGSESPTTVPQIAEVQTTDAGAEGSLNGANFYSDKY